MSYRFLMGMGMPSSGPFLPAQNCPRRIWKCPLIDLRYDRPRNVGKKYAKISPRGASNKGEMGPKRMGPQTVVMRAQTLADLGRNWTLLLKPDSVYLPTLDA